MRPYFRKSDFLLTFHHDAVPVSMDADRFPFVVLGQDRLLAVSSVSNGKPLFQLEDKASLLAYGQNSFLGRLANYAASQANLKLTASHVSDNAVAEILKAMVSAVMAWHGSLKPDPPRAGRRLAVRSRRPCHHGHSSLSFGRKDKAGGH